MYELVITSQFKKDLKKVKKQHPKDFELSREVVKNLQSKGVKGLSLKMKPHKLTGNFKGHLECHIRTALLIIWIQRENPKIIKLIRIGSHSDLFR